MSFVWTSNTSSIGRRGVGGGLSSISGADPTRIKTWGVVVWSIKRCDDIPARPELGDVGQRAGGQARHRGLQQYGGEHFAALQHAGAFVVVRRQHENLRVVMAELEAPICVVCDREVASDIDTVAFRRRHQRAVRYPVGDLERSCPPGQFRVIGRIVEAQTIR